MTAQQPGFRLINSEVKPLTKEFAEYFRKLEPSPTERGAQSFPFGFPASEGRRQPAAPLPVGNGQDGRQGLPRERPAQQYYAVPAERDVPSQSQRSSRCF